MNTSVKIKCASPTIIINPQLEYYYNNIVNIHYYDYNVYKSNTFKVWVKYLSKLKHNDITYDNINDYYCVLASGEIIFLYILVPCNKCFICKDKYIKQWQFRAIAESNISNNNTYMVTLTYNNDYLPYKGVNIRAVQLFIKRLRHNLDKLNIDHHIKYIAVGEYGKNTKRPHYHLILWHFPDDKFKNITEILHFIEHSWSCYNFETQSHESIGFAYCTPVNKNSVKYCLKYCFKQRNIPTGKNDSFFTCSKRIGYQYFIDNYEYLSNNPELLSISIIDNISGQIFVSPYPQYFKYLIMPHISQIFPKEITQLYQHCLNLHLKLYTLNDIENLGYKTPDVLYKYYDIFYDTPYNSHPLDDNYIDSYYNIYYNTFHNEHIYTTYYSLYNELTQYITLLSLYYERNKLRYFTADKIKNKRQQHISLLPQRDFLLTELQAINEKIENNVKKNLYKEKF